MIEYTYKQKYQSQGLPKSNTYRKKNGFRLRAVISNTQPCVKTTQKHKYGCENYTKT